MVHGRVFQTIGQVRAALRSLAARHDAAWLIGKNGYRSPLEARAAWLDTTLSRAAWCSPVSREPGAVQALP